MNEPLIDKKEFIILIHFQAHNLNRDKVNKRYIYN